MFGRVRWTKNQPARPLLARPRGPALADPMDPAVVTLSAQLSRLWGLPSLHLLGGVGMPTYRVTQRNHGQGPRFLALKNGRGNKVKPQLISCKGEIAVGVVAGVRAGQLAGLQRQPRVTSRLRNIQLRRSVNPKVEVGPGCAQDPDYGVA